MFFKQSTRSVTIVTQFKKKLYPFAHDPFHQLSMDLVELVENSYRFSGTWYCLNLFMVNLKYYSINLCRQHKFNMRYILCSHFIILLLIFLNIGLFLVWFAPKVATGGRTCWRKKWSTLLENGTYSSFSYISNSSINATVTVHEPPCCFSLFKSLSWKFLWLRKWHVWLNFQEYILPCLILLLGKLAICIEQHLQQTQLNNVTEGRTSQLWSEDMKIDYCSNQNCIT